jgi:hypothetical protein
VRLDEIYRELKDRMRFLTVYVREAHPADGWVSQNNVDAGICFNLPRTPDDRVAIARELIEKMDFTIPLALDDMENGAAQLYGALPTGWWSWMERASLAIPVPLGPTASTPRHGAPPFWNRSAADHEIS